MTVVLGGTRLEQPRLQAGKGQHLIWGSKARSITEFRNDDGSRHRNDPLDGESRRIYLGNDGGDLFIQLVNSAI